MTGSRKRLIAILAVAAVVLIGGAGTLAFYQQRDGLLGNTVSELPPKDARAAAVLDNMLTGPVSFEHNLYAGDYGAQTYGAGYLDISSGCTMDAAYTGALYTVELRAKDGNFWERSTKRETKLLGDWETVLPLNSNMNSILATLAGNPYTMLCELRDLTRSITADSDIYTLNAHALTQMVTKRRVGELAKLMTLAGMTPDAISEKTKNLKFDLVETTGLFEKVYFEQNGPDALRIVAVGNDNRILEELVIRRATSRVIATPASAIDRGDRVAEIRAMLDLDNKN